MVDLTGLHKHFILEHLGEGDTAVDFTMGNGHDTEYLCKKVHFYANFVGYWLISNGKEPMSSPSTKKSAVYQPICRISSTSQ